MKKLILTMATLITGASLVLATPTVFADVDTNPSTQSCPDCPANAVPADNSVDEMTKSTDSTTNPDPSINSGN